MPEVVAGPAPAASGSGGGAEPAAASADIVRTTIDAELALLERIAPSPSAPFGYGADLICTTDLTAQMDEVDPTSTRALAEALLRRLDTPRGALPDDADYGRDLRAMVNRGVTTDDVRAIAGQVRSELEKDDRVDAARVIVTPAADGSRLRVQCWVTPVDPRIGGFTMTLAVTSAEILIEEISR